MIIFFGKGKYESDVQVQKCLAKYANLTNDLNCGSHFESITEEIENPIICRNGKPHFENSNVKFSVSHSHGFFVIAFSDSEVGIDLEFVRKIDNRKFSRLIDFESDEDFFKKWTAYEALAKYTGKGISFIFGGIEQIEKEKAELMNEGVILTQIPVFKGYVCTAASKQQEIILVKYDNE
ncbi:MAG: hypothetical protein PHE93_01565 [Clostridia bacterium]|nr:hypothetical protein [Clostridia bacterium]